MTHTLRKHLPHSHLSFLSFTKHVAAGDDWVYYVNIAVLTLSDKGARGERVDTSGPVIEALVGSVAGRVARRALLPDSRVEIESLLRAWCSAGDVDVILTTGGTGFSPRDITPEATLAVLERHAPGLAELMRAEGLKHTPMAAVSRAVAGVRGRTLIVNLPGSEKGVRESLGVLLPLLPHIVETLRGDGGDHVSTETGVRPT